MRTNLKRRGIAAAATVGAVALSIGVALPANADYAPSGADAVGVGGDTPQYDLSFLADGDIVGNAGYNAANNVKKFVSFDSVPDANGRNAFDSTSTPGVPKNLNPSIVLRAGTAPIQRVPSTGVGYSTFLDDTTKQINWIRTGRLPKAAEQDKAAARGWGSLHSIKIATDTIDIAVSNETTNAPAGLSEQDLLGIYKGTYTTWNQIPGNAGGSTEAIVPLIPPASSVVRTTLFDKLTTLNGGPWTLVGTARVVQQNDPTAISTLPDLEKRNAIVTFSKARLSLWNGNGTPANGYFRDVSQSFAVATPALAPKVKLLVGASPGGSATFSQEIGHYVVFRESDYQTLGPWQAGSTKNWVKTLFYDGLNGSPFIKKAAGQALIAASGATPTYVDEGSNFSG